MTAHLHAACRLPDEPISNRTTTRRVTVRFIHPRSGRADTASPIAEFNPSHEKERTMPSYSLKLEIAAADLAIIRAAGLRLTLARPVGNGDPNVVWLALDPFPSTVIQWDESYWIFASTTPIVHGATVTILSEILPGPALDAGIYSFTPSGEFGAFEPVSSIPAGTYAVANNMPYDHFPLLTFGLSQSPQVAPQPVEPKPISVRSVLSQQKTELTPLPVIFIWLQNEFTSETIITRITANVTIARYGNGISELTTVYDPHRGIFVPATNLEDMIDSNIVELRTPLLT
jgi:hypothetical protein